MQRIETKTKPLVFDLAQVLTDEDKQQLLKCVRALLAEKIFNISTDRVWKVNLPEETISFQLKQSLFFYWVGDVPKAYIIADSDNEKGRYGSVADVLGRLRLTENDCIIQRLNGWLAKCQIVTKQVKENLQYETVLAKRMPYLLPVKGPFYQPETPLMKAVALIVMRRVKGKVLESYLLVGADHKQLNPLAFTALQRLRLFSALIRASLKVHAANIVHRDMAPKNLIITLEPYCSARWIDFGLSIDAAVKDKNYAGTAAYLSPNSYQGYQTQADDGFSVGLIGGMLFGADEMNAELEITGDHYHFVNLFHGMTGFKAGEKRMLKDCVTGLVMNDPQSRHTLEMSECMVRELKYHALLKLNDDDCVAALLKGQTYRDNFAKTKLSSWLDGEPLLTALNDFRNALTEVANKPQALAIFIEEAEFGPGAECKTKSTMLMIIRKYMTQIKSQTERFDQVKRRVDALEDSEFKTTMADKLTALQTFFAVPVYWDDLLHLLPTLDRKLTKLQNQLASPVSHVDLSLFATNRRVLRSQTKQKSLRC